MEEEEVEEEEEDMLFVYAQHSVSHPQVHEREMYFPQLFFVLPLDRPPPPSSAASGMGLTEKRK